MATSTPGPGYLHFPHLFGNNTRISGLSMFSSSDNILLFTQLSARFLNRSIALAADPDIKLSLIRLVVAHHRIQLFLQWVRNCMNNQCTASLQVVASLPLCQFHQQTLKFILLTRQSALNRLGSASSLSRTHLVVDSWSINRQGTSGRRSFRIGTNHFTLSAGRSCSKPWQ